MRMVLPQRFFNRPAIKVAKELLGKFLVRRIGKREIAVMISETEAYIGPHDLACHASRGRTPRTEAMFSEAGRLYVYFTYGMHWMLNVVTGKKGYPAAVLLRGGKWQIANGKWIDINGPARLTKFLKVDKRFNGKPATKNTGLWFAAPSKKKLASLRKKFGAGGLKIKRGPRVGVDYAGRWAKKPYNFKLKI